MNNLWSLMVADVAVQEDGFTLAEPAFAIYEAFDAGEWDHGKSCDPNGSLATGRDHLFSPSFSVNWPQILF